MKVQLRGRPPLAFEQPKAWAGPVSCNELLDRRFISPSRQHCLPRAHTHAPRRSLLPPNLDKPTTGPPGDSLGNAALLRRGVPLAARRSPCLRATPGGPTEPEPQMLLPLPCRLPRVFTTIAAPPRHSPPRLFASRTTPRSPPTRCLTSARPSEDPPRPPPTPLIVAAAPTQKPSYDAVAKRSLRTSTRGAPPSDPTHGPLSHHRRCNHEIAAPPPVQRT